MLDPKTIWNKFSKYPLWLKCVIFIPTILLIILIGVLILFMKSKDIDSSPDELFQENEDLNREIDDFKETQEIIQEEREEIAKQREEIKKELENEETNLSDCIDRIDSARDDELSSIAAELRARTSKDIS